MKHATGIPKTSTQNYRNFTNSKNYWEALPPEVEHHLICKTTGRVIEERIT